MSFAAGMGAGIGCGIAIGVAAGEKQACQHLREYAEAKSLTIRDQSGGEIDIDTFISCAVKQQSLGKRGKVVLITLLLLGVAALGVVSYMVFT